MDLEKNLIEVICCLSVSPVSSTDLTSKQKKSSTSSFFRSCLWSVCFSFIKAHAPSLLHLRERVCCHISTEAGGLVWHFRSQQLCKAFHSTTHPLCLVQSVKITAVSFSQQHLVNVTCVSHLHQVKQHFSSRLVSSYEDLMIGFAHC